MKKIAKENLLQNLNLSNNFEEVEENLMFTVEGSCSKKPAPVPTPNPRPSKPSKPSKPVKPVPGPAPAPTPRR